MNPNEPVFSIIIPTWNNPQFLDPCVNSILGTGVLHTGVGELIIVNNGKQDCKSQFKDVPNLKVVGEGTNLGWEGGLKLGIQHARGRFLCFQNDDTFIAPTSSSFYERMLTPFQDKKVGAVGPTTTVAAGIQSIYHPANPRGLTNVRWLIFFTVMIRREALFAVGGIDDTLPGGDDFDLSIRLNKGGYKTVINPSAFIIHHGFKTGTRVHGDHNVDGGWNSQKMTERTTKALIQKHGFRTFFETWTRQVITSDELALSPDSEGGLIRALIKKSDKVLELGCGFRKTVPWAVGVDRVAKGKLSNTHSQEEHESVADIAADVAGPIPTTFDYDVIIARHILEHIIDTPKVLRNWTRHLKPGGRLIIAVPDEEVTNSIPMNPEHCHAFTPDSLKEIAELVGLTQLATQSAHNGVSFISVFERPVPMEARCTLDRQYDGDCSTIPLESYIVRGND